MAMTPEQIAAMRQQFIANGGDPAVWDAQAGQLTAGQSTSPYPSLAANDQVYLGANSPPIRDPRGAYGARTQGGPFTPQTTSGGPHYVSGTEAMAYLQRAYDHNDPIYLHTKQLMIEAGVLQADASVPQVMSAWADYAQLSARAHDDGRAVTPWDYLEGMARQNNHGAGVPTTTTHVSTSTSRASGEDLEAIVQGASQQTLGGLGRRARADELKGSVGKLRSADAANPTTTRTTTTTDAKGNSTSNSNTQQGIGQAGLSELATQRVMQSKDYGAYQAAGLYFPALLQALGATANVQ